MAEAFNIPVVSHLLPEIHVHLVAAAPNATVVEYMPWTWRLFDDPPMPKDGMMTLPKAPGLGFGFAPDLLREIRRAVGNCPEAIPVSARNAIN